MTESLKILTENTAKMVGGSAISKRYTDFIYPQKQDERSGDEIVADIVKRAGLVVV